MTAIQCCALYCQLVVDPDDLQPGEEVWTYADGYQDALFPSHAEQVAKTTRSYAEEEARLRAVQAQYTEEARRFIRPQPTIQYFTD